MLFLVFMISSGRFLFLYGIGILDDSFQHFKLVWSHNNSNYEDFVYFGDKDLGQLHKLWENCTVKEESVSAESTTSVPNSTPHQTQSEVTKTHTSGFSTTVPTRRAIATRRRTPLLPAGIKLISRFVTRRRSRKPAYVPRYVSTPVYTKQSAYTRSKNFVTPFQAVGLKLKETDENPHIMRFLDPPNRKNDSHIYFTAAIKSDFQESDKPQYIIETSVKSLGLGVTRYFKLFFQNSALAWTWSWSVNQVDISDRYSCYNAITDEMRIKWVLLVVKFNFIDCMDDYPKVSLKVKPLDIDLKEPVRELQCRKVADTVFHSETKAGDHYIALGRGYTGQVAYANLFRSTFTDFDVNDMLRLQLPTKIGFNLGKFELLWVTNEIKYHIPNSRIRMDLEMDVSAMYYTYIVCDPASINIGLTATAFNISIPQLRPHDKEPHYPINITLGNNNLEEDCNFKYVSIGECDDMGMFVIENKGLKTCGCKRSKTETGDIMYKNKVYVSSGTFSRHLLDVSCVYENFPTTHHNVRIAAFAVENDNIQIRGKATKPQLNFTLALYSDINFEVQLQIPVKVADKDILYVEAVAVSAFDNIKLQLESCYTKVVLDPLSNVTHQLIEGGKAADKSVKFLQSPGSSKVRFRFKAAKFHVYPDAVVYLDCQMTASDSR